jgi:hypothetical protein
LRDPTIGIGITAGEYCIYVFLKCELEYQPLFSRSQLLQSQMTRVHTGKVVINESKGEKERLPESVSKAVRHCVRGHVRKVKGTKSLKGM